MASGSRTTNTMSEGLQKLLGDIANLKMTPDADLPFLINLETSILGYLKQGADQALQPSPGAPPGMAGGATTPALGMAPGMGSGPGTGTPQGVPGVMQGPAMPNPDELRRVLQR